MNVREDRVNELIQEISSMKRKFVDEQVTLIEDYFSNGPVGNGQGVFTMLEEYLYEINRIKDSNLWKLLSEYSWFYKYYRCNW